MSHAIRTASRLSIKVASKQPGVVMTLYEELIREVKPFYSAKVKGSRTYRPRYPPDHNGKHYCPVHGFLPFAKFRKYGERGLKRDCKECENNRSKAIQARWRC